MSSSTSTWSTKVTSQYHRGTFCGPCFICGKEEERYDHFDGLRHEVQQFLVTHSGTYIPGNSCICRSHRREAQRQHLNSGYVPKWKVNKENLAPQTHYVCVYKECSVTSETGKVIAPSDETLDSFSTKTLFLNL